MVETGLTIPSRREPQYLGDGVYAYHDGYQVWLYAWNGVAETTHIAVEPAVLRALIEYGKQTGLLSGEGR